MKEQQLQAKILKYLLAIGAYSVKVISASKAGVPDILVCYKGRFIGIEVKIFPNKPSALQIANIQMIKDAGGIAGVAYSLQDVINIID